MKTKKNLFKKGIAALLAALILVSGSAALFTQGSTSQVAGGGETTPTIEPVITAVCPSLPRCKNIL